MDNKLKQYNAIDAMKFFSAILIIILHTSPMASYSKAASFVLRNIVTIIAVPFFFSTSGFILFKKIGGYSNTEKKQYFKKYIKRLLLMYIIWSIIYLPFVIYGWTQDGFSILEILSYIKRFFFVGSYSTIWFLPACAFAALLCFYLRKIFSFKTIIIIAAVFYLCACLITNYYGLMEKIPSLSFIMDRYYSFFETAKNGLLFGFIFVAIGGVISESKWLLRISRVKVFTLLIISGFMVALESVLPKLCGFSSFGCDIKISLMPFTVFLMLLLINENLPDKKIYITMRKMSLMMFLSQRIFISLANIFLTETIIHKNSLLYFLFILSTTMAFSACIIKLSEKIKLLKYCY